MNNSHKRESLISELAYAITRLDRDTGTSVTRVMTHNIIVSIPQSNGQSLEKVCLYFVHYYIFIDLYYY